MKCFSFSVSCNKSFTSAAALADASCRHTLTGQSVSEIAAMKVLQSAVEYQHLLVRWFISWIIMVWLHVHWQTLNTCSACRYAYEVISWVFVFSTCSPSLYRPGGIFFFFILSLFSVDIFPLDMLFICSISVVPEGYIHDGDGFPSCFYADESHY